MRGIFGKKSQLTTKSQAQKAQAKLTQADAQKVLQQIKQIVDIAQPPMVDESNPFINNAVTKPETIPASSGFFGSLFSKTPASKQVKCKFSPEKYSEYYQDIKAAFGNDLGKITNHFKEYGIQEGRTPCGNINPECIFDPYEYAELNPDIKEAFGNDLGKITNHFKEYGIQEGRPVCVTKMMGGKKKTRARKIKRKTSTRRRR